VAPPSYELFEVIHYKLMTTKNLKLSFPHFDFYLGVNRVNSASEEHARGIQGMKVGEVPHDDHLRRNIHQARLSFQEIDAGEWNWGMPWNANGHVSKHGPCRAAIALFYACHILESESYQQKWTQRAKGYRKFTEYPKFT